MIEGIPAALLDQIGVVAVVLIVGFMMMRGKIVPQAFMEMVVGLLNERLARVIEDRDNWREAYQDMAKINDSLLRREDLSTATLRSIKEAAVHTTAPDSDTAGSGGGSSP